MNLRKKLLALLMLIVLMFSFVGCAKCINTEYKQVEVTIVDEYHRGMWLQPVRIGKVSSIITHPEICRITVEYNGVKYTINDKDTYDKYKDKVGEIAIAELKINTYDDGSTSSDITSLA